MLLGFRWINSSPIIIVLCIQIRGKLYGDDTVTPEHIVFNASDLTAEYYQQLRDCRQLENRGPVRVHLASVPLHVTGFKLRVRHVQRGQ